MLKTHRLHDVSTLVRLRACGRPSEWIPAYAGMTTWLGSQRKPVPVATVGLPICATVDHLKTPYSIRS
jgi:hypothetical protein